MRQAIQTKFFGATPYTSPRIRATAKDGAVLYDWNEHLSEELNHIGAALRLITMLNWPSRIIGTGQLKDQSFVHILAPK
jgi:hypothetical protein